MAQYIERAKVTDALIDNTSIVGSELEEAVNAICAIPAADVRPVEWIPVTERLPEEYKDVLCYYEYFRYGDYNCMFRTIDRGYYCDGIWGGEAGQGHKNKVLAWMPLPEPPIVTDIDVGGKEG